MQACTTSKHVSTRPYKRLRRTSGVGDEYVVAGHVASHHTALYPESCIPSHHGSPHQVVICHVTACPGVSCLCSKLARWWLLLLPFLVLLLLLLLFLFLLLLLLFLVLQKWNTVRDILNASKLFIRLLALKESVPPCLCVFVVLFTHVYVQ